MVIVNHFSEIKKLLMEPLKRLLVKWYKPRKRIERGNKITKYPDKKVVMVSKN